MRRDVAIHVVVLGLAASAPIQEVFAGDPVRAETMPEPNRFTESDAAGRADDPLGLLVGEALARNPTLAGRAAEVDAAWARVPQVVSLPDPAVGSLVYGLPIETAAGSLRANLQLSQRLPPFRRLDAQGRQAAAEAEALVFVLQADRLRVVAEVREAYYRAFVIGQQLRINRAERLTIDSLADVASLRVRGGREGQGDVLRADLERSRLEREEIAFRRELEGIGADLVALLNRPPGEAPEVPESIQIAYRRWDLAELVAVARRRQPEVLAASLRQEASRWGVEVARLRRVPDLTASFQYFFVDDNRPIPAVVDVGRDAFGVGLGVELPIWGRKYDAIEREAKAEARTANANFYEQLRRTERLLADLKSEADAAFDTVRLFEGSILPRARQTLQADRRAYRLPEGGVDFDRVANDFRAVVAFESDYYAAIGRLAIALARLEQAVGAPLASIPGVDPTATLTRTNDDDGDRSADEGDAPDGTSGGPDADRP